MKLIKNNAVLTQHVINLWSLMPWGSETNSLVQSQKSLDFYISNSNTHS